VRLGVGESFPNRAEKVSCGRWAGRLSEIRGQRRRSALVARADQWRVSGDGSGIAFYPALNIGRVHSMKKACGMQGFFLQVKAQRCACWLRRTLPGGSRHAIARIGVCTDRAAEFRSRRAPLVLYSRRVCCSTIVSYALYVRILVVRGGHAQDIGAFFFHRSI